MGEGCQFLVDEDMTRCYGGDFAVLYGFLRFWERRLSRDGKRFWVSNSYVENRLAISRAKQKALLRKMADAGFVEIKVRPGRTSLYKLL